MLISGIAEMVSLAAVLPFLTILSEPDRLWEQPLVQQLASRSGYTSADQLLLPTTVAFATAAVLAALIRMANMWINGRLAAAVGSDFSCDVYRHILCQSYEVHVQRNSAEVITATTNQIGSMVAVLNSFLQIITSGVVAVGLLTCLMLIDAPAAVSTALLFSSAYSILATTTRKELYVNSYKIDNAIMQQIKALQEGLGSIRDVILDNTQSTYLQIFKQADIPHRKLQAKNAFLSNSPRYALEALGIVAIAFVGYLLAVQTGSRSAVIPRLGAMALGAQRLLPSLQQIYSGWASLRSNDSAIQNILNLLSQPIPNSSTIAGPLQLHKYFRLENVHFRYGKDQSEVLSGISLDIHRGERVGIIGITGSGKSTMVDIIMGLLPPTRGRVLVDEVDLHDHKSPERLIGWRASIAHVPQNIYLADRSFAENIAFGESLKSIDLARIKSAAAKAQIASFIESTPNGYQTFVGERGIRLSGGQRQRIAIARALYKKASVLIFDEATSALDGGTEDAVIQAIEEIGDELTIVMIAHRLSTVKRCDRVIRLANGAIVADGPPHLVLA